MDLSLWRDISIVWLSILCLIGLVIPLALSYFAVIAMHRVLNIVPSYLERAQHLSASVHSKTILVSQNAAQPVVQAERQVARLITIWHTLWPMRPPQSEAPEKGFNHGD